MKRLCVCVPLTLLAGAVGQHADDHAVGHDRHDALQMLSLSEVGATSASLHKVM